jgi:anti-sigma factor RsiW
MITCRELVDLLIDFVSGELPPERHQRIEQHLRCCPGCLTYLETYQLTIRLTRRLPCQPLPPELADRLRQALEDIRKEQKPEAGPSCGEVSSAGS